MTAAIGATCSQLNPFLFLAALFATSCYAAALSLLVPTEPGADTRMWKACAAIGSFARWLWILLAASIFTLILIAYKDLIKDETLALYVGAFIGAAFPALYFGPGSFRQTYWTILHDALVRAKQSGRIADPTMREAIALQGHVLLDGSSAEREAALKEITG